MKKRPKKFFLSDRKFYTWAINNIDMENAELNRITKNLDEIYDQQSRKLYNHIMEMGIDAFNKESALYKYRDTDLIQKLIDHFVSTEEYEKCRDLQKVSWLLNGIEE